MLYPCPLPPVLTALFNGTHFAMLLYLNNVYMYCLEKKNCKMSEEFCNTSNEGTLQYEFFMDHRSW